MGVERRREAISRDNQKVAFLFLQSMAFWVSSSVEYFIDCELEKC
jgi:hypothetical protein